MKKTGGSNSYYVTRIENPVHIPEPYTAECIDIIRALNMNWSESNMFKAIWRKAAARNGLPKPGNTAVYDAEKTLFFAKIDLDDERRWVRLRELKDMADIEDTAAGG